MQLKSLNFIQNAFNRLSQMQKIWLIGLVSALLLSFLAPADVRFPYSFKEGDFWRYKNVYADFEFNIKKKQAEIDSISAYLDRTFPPYYVIDTAITKESLAHLETIFDKQLNLARKDNLFGDVYRNQTSYFNFTKKRLEKVYQRGVIKLAEIHRNKPNDFKVRIVKPFGTEELPLLNALTPAKASSAATDSLPYTQLTEPEFLYLVLEKAIEPNAYFNEELTYTFKNERLFELSESNTKVKKGELLVKKGDVITPDIYKKLLSYEENYERLISSKKSPWLIRLGYFMLCSLLLAVVWLYLNLYENEEHNKIRYLAAIYASFFIFALAACVVFNLDQSLYIVPLAVLPMFLKQYFKARTVIFVHAINLLLNGVLFTQEFEMLFMYLTAGFVAITFKKEFNSLKDLIPFSIYLLVTYSIAYLGFMFVQKGNFELMDFSLYKWLSLNVGISALVMAIYLWFRRKEA